MRRGKIDRKTLVKTAISLFYENGYHNTTMDDIAKTCSIQKSSLYHHIPSRKALVILVMRHLIEYFQENHFQIAFNQDIPPHERLARMARATREYFTEQNKGCLIYNLAMETGTPEVKHIAEEYFNSWTDALSHIFSSQYPTNEAQSLAKNFVSEIQGAIMLSKLFSPKLIITATDKLTTQLEASETPA